MTEPVTDRLPEDEPDFGLTSDEGNARLRRLLAEVLAQAQRGEVGRREALVVLGDGVQAISADHPEVTDVTVRTAIVQALDPVFTGEGWERIDPFEF